MSKEKVPKNAVEVWKLMRSYTESIPKCIRPSEHNKKRKFQLFEVVAASLFSILNNSIKWTVTPVQGDNGIDFSGEIEIIPKSKFIEPAKMILGGQCKALDLDRKNKIDIIGQFSTDFFRMKESINPNFFSCLIACLNGKFKPKDLSEAKASFQRQLAVNTEVLGLEQVEHLIKENYRKIRPVITKSSLSKEKIKTIDSYFSTIDKITKNDLSVDLSIACDGKAQSGIPFKCNISINSHYLSSGRINLIYRKHKTYLSESGKDSEDSIKVLSPKQIIEKKGFDVNVEWNQKYVLNLTFLSYLTGEIELGFLDIFDKDNFVDSISLGLIHLSDTFTPPFFWTNKNREYSINFERILENAFSGEFNPIAVLGYGGNGKSRFCQELGFISETKGAEFASLSHQNNFENPYGIIRDILSALCVPLNDVESPLDTVKRVIHSNSPSLAQKSEPTLEVIFSIKNTEQSTFADHSVIVTVLIFLLRLKALNKTFVLHLSDMHWCHGQVLQLFIELIKQIKFSGNNKHSRIIIIFEGRISEINTKTKDLNKKFDFSSASFENFVNSNIQNQFLISSLTRIESFKFLKNFFEFQDRFNPKLTKKLIPHQSDLLENIVLLANGNPFYMIEIIRSLRDKGFIRKNNRTGRLFLIKKLPKNFHIPVNVELMIKARFKYLSRNNPQLANLIQAVALIKNRIEFDLYKKLIKKIGNGISNDDVEKTEFLFFEETSFGNIKFRHELYFQTIRNIKLDEYIKEKVVEVYLKFLNCKDSELPLINLEKALVLKESKSFDFQKIKHFLVRASNQAQKRKETILLTRVLSELIKLFGPIDDSLEKPIDVNLEISRIIRSYAELNLWHGDREESVKQLEELIDHLNRVKEKTKANCLYENFFEFEYELNMTKVQYANALMNQFKSHKAIETILGSLPSIKSSYSQTSGVSEKILKNQWSDLLSLSFNRLGVAYKIEGCIDESIKAHLDSFESFISKNKEAKFGIYFDLARTYCLVDQKRASNYLKMSKAILVDSDLNKKYKCMLDIAKLNFDVLTLNKKGTKALNKSLENIFHKSQNVYFESIKLGLGMEIAASALLCGSLKALMKDRSAYDWFMEAINITFTKSYYEMLWKAHLNLSQYCLGDKSFNEDAYQHAIYVYKYIIEDDLFQRDPLERQWRTRKMERPIAQLYRVLKNFNDPNADTLKVNFACIKRNNRFLSKNIEFLKLDKSEYFLF